MLAVLVFALSAHAPVNAPSAGASRPALDARHAGGGRWSAARKKGKKGRKAATPKPSSEPDLFEPDLPEPKKPAPAPAAPKPAGGDSGGEPDIPDVPEPDLPLGPGPGGPAAEAPRIMVQGEPESIEVVEPDAVSSYSIAKPGAPLQLRVRGPGILVLEMHAPRLDAEPSTLGAIVVTVAVDGAAIPSATIDQPVDGRYGIVGGGMPLSARVTVQEPIAGGEHTVTLTAPAAATRGVLARARLEQGIVAPPPPEPQQVIVEVPVVVHEPAPAGAAPPPEVHSPAQLGAFVGGWLPGALSSPGFEVLAAGDFGFSIGRQRFGIGASVGFCRAEHQRTAQDPRTASGALSLHLALNTVPLHAVARWSADLTDWLELSLGAGGGIIVAWVDTSVDTVTASSASQVAPSGIFELTMLFRLPLGGIAVRAQLDAAAPLSTAVFSDYSPGGGSLLAGWIFEI